MNRTMLTKLLAVFLLLGLPIASHAQASDRITIEELKALVATKMPVLILDVRNEIDTKIKGAVHIPLGEVEARAAELPREREIVTYCA